MTKPEEQTGELDAIEHALKRPGLPVAALLGTMIWILLVTWVAIQKDLWSLKANEIGDFIAGGFAPVAFGWLILGYLRQGRELRLQSAEIALTRSEFAAQTKVLQDQRDYDRVLMNVSLLNKAADEIPHRMIEFFEALAPFQKVKRGVGKGEVHHTGWNKTPRPDDAEGLRVHSKQFENSISHFDESFDLSMTEAFEMTTPEALRELTQRADDLFRWDAAFRSSEEAMEQALWRGASRKFGLDVLTTSLLRIFGDVLNDAA